MNQYDNNKIFFLRRPDLGVVTRALFIERPIESTTRSKRIYTQATSGRRHAVEYRLQLPPPHRVAAVVTTPSRPLSTFSRARASPPFGLPPPRQTVVTSRSPCRAQRERTVFTTTRKRLYYIA